MRIHTIINVARIGLASKGKILESETSAITLKKTLILDHIQNIKFTPSTTIEMVSLMYKKSQTGKRMKIKKSNEKLTV